MRLHLPALVLCALLLPSPCLALETSTERTGRCEIFWETEGPYIQSGSQLYALPSEETAIRVTYEDAEKLVAFLRKHCERTPGCELTFETETRAVMAAKAPGGQSVAVAYRPSSKERYPGQPRTVRTRLLGWSWDTFTLSARTSNGTFCIPNSYAWKDYQDRVFKALSRFGGQEAALDAAVTLTVHPAVTPSEDCQGYLADVTPAQ